MSTTDARRPVPARAARLRGRVARRPLTAFLVLVAVVGWPLMSVPALTAHGVLPGGRPAADVHRRRDARRRRARGRRAARAGCADAPPGGRHRARRRRQPAGRRGRARLVQRLEQRGQPGRRPARRRPAHALRDRRGGAVHGRRPARGAGSAPGRDGGRPACVAQWVLPWWHDPHRRPRAAAERQPVPRTGQGRRDGRGDRARRAGRGPGPTLPCSDGTRAADRRGPADPRQRTVPHPRADHAPAGSAQRFRGPRRAACRAAVIALDSSALVKLVLDEPESPALETWLSARLPLTVTASDLVRVEVIRAVARTGPAGVPRARALLAGVDLVPLSPDLLEVAADLAPPSLRSL